MNIQSPNAPSISIIIPTLNEARNIEIALLCIVNNEIPSSDLEILVIDGGSTDGTKDKVLKFADQLPLIIIDAPGASVYKALNIGLEKSRGKYFVRVDARSEIPYNYIKTCISHLQRSPIECVGGIQLQYGNSAISNSIARVTSSFIGTGGAKFRTAKESGYVDSVYLGVYKTNTLRELGGYEDRSEYVSEDSFINKRIRDRGGKIYLDANMAVRYPAKSTFRALVKQYLIYGAAKAFLVRKHGKLTSFRQCIPLIGLALLVILMVGVITEMLPVALLSFIVMSYVAIIAIANSLNTKYHAQDPGNMIARSIATVCIHFAWPIGFFIFLLNPALHKRLVLSI